MRIAFVQNLWVEYMGVISIASFLKLHGHQCEIFIKTSNKQFMNDIYKFQPEVVGFPCNTGTYKWCLETLNKLKVKFTFVSVFGGPHPTINPQIIKEKNIDIVCRGEGEEAFLELVNELQKGGDIAKIKNLWVKKNKQIYKNEIRNLIENINLLPNPDRDLYNKYDYFKKSTTRVFITGRYCPYSCSYCINHTSKKLYRGKGNYYRKLRVDKVIEHIAIVKKDMYLRSVLFVDDIFLSNKKWLKEFAEKYSNKIGLPFFCCSRADQFDEESVKLLKKSGCFAASIGIESGNERIRNKILNKRVSNKEIIRAGELLDKYKIISRSTNMFCLPEETISDAWDTVHLNMKAFIKVPSTSIFQPFPGLELTKYSKEHGYLNYDNEDINFNTTYYKKNKLNLKDNKKIYNLNFLFYYAVKWSWTHFLIRIIIKIPSNIFFAIAYYIGFVHNFSKYRNINIFETIRFGLKNFLK